MNFLEGINLWLNNFLLHAGIWAPVLSSLLVILEGVFAFLPLFVFVTINFMTLGPFFGTIISWICTVIGCMLTFFLFRKGVREIFYRFIDDKEQIKKFMKIVDNIKFSHLVLLMAIPFTPSFFVNLGSGLSKIKIKKFFYALLISKLFTIIFWGCVGTTLIQSLTNPLAFLKVLLLVVIAYLISLVVNKKFKFDERV